MAVTYATRVRVGSTAAQQAQTSPAGATVGTQAQGVASQLAASTPTARNYAAEAILASVAPNLSAAAIGALTGARIRPIVSASLEVESNRLRRAATVTLRRGDTLAAVPTLDPVDMDAQSLIDSRRNPTERWCIADVSLADDGCLAWQPLQATVASGVAETVPIAFDRTCLSSSSVPNGNALGLASIWTIYDSALGTSSNLGLKATADVDASGFVWEINKGTAYAAGSFATVPAPACSYYQPNGVDRDFTVVAYIASITGTFIGCLELEVSDGLHTVTVDGPTFSLAAVAGMAQSTRVASPIVIPNQGGARNWSTMTVRIKVLAGSTMSHAYLDCIQAYAGADRGGFTGLTAAVLPGVTGKVPIIEETWTDPRNVNRVEITGERRAGRIMSARVDVATGVVAGTVGAPGLLVPEISFASEAAQTTQTITAPLGSLIIAVVSFFSSSSVGPGTFTISDTLGGLTWQLVESVKGGVGNFTDLAVFVATSKGVNGTVTVTPSRTGAPNSGIGVRLYSVTGATGVGATGTSNGTGTVALSAAPAASSLVFSALAQGQGSDPANTIPAGYTSIRTDAHDGTYLYTSIAYKNGSAAQSATFGGSVSNAAAVSLEILAAPVTTWAVAGSAWGGGRLAVVLDQTYLTTGVRVYVEETTGGDLSPVWVTEVDPMLVYDVSTDVASLSATWAREADPGQATNPVGNFQSSSVTLELDNTANKYSPAANASFDRGHRVEVALGVRYRNLWPNPRLDVDAAGWSLGSRKYPATKGGPNPASYCLTGAVTTGGFSNTTIIAGVIPVTAGTNYEYGAWYYCSGGDTNYLGYVQVAYYDAALNVTGTQNNAFTALGATGWQYAKANMVAPTGTVWAYIFINVAGYTNGMTYTIEATEASLVELDGLGQPVEYAELVPAGVFYADPWDAPSNSQTVTITANDKLGRLGSTAITEDVRINQTIGGILASLALRYLDLDTDQQAFATSLSSYVIQFATPPDSGDLATYLADLAKATLGALYVDSLERLALQDTGQIPLTASAELRSDNALIDHARPSSSDTTTSVVNVTASPLVPAAPLDVYDLPSGGIQIATGATYRLVCDYSTTPAILPTVSGVVADGPYTITSVVPLGATKCVVTILNTAGTVLTVATLSVMATPLVAGSLTTRVIDTPSYQRYGAVELDVDARLIQTQAQLDTVAAVLISAYRGLDSNGVRKLPDVALNALGLVHVELGDLVSVVDPRTGIGASYQLINRTLSYATSGSLLLAATARQAVGSPFAICDVSIADDIYVAGY